MTCVSPQTPPYHYCFSLSTVRSSASSARRSMREYAFLEWGNPNVADSRTGSLRWLAVDGKKGDDRGRRPSLSTLNLCFNFARCERLVKKLILLSRWFINKGVWTIEGGNTGPGWGRWLLDNGRLSGTTRKSIDVNVIGQLLQNFTLCNY